MHRWMFPVAFAAASMAACGSPPSAATTTKSPLPPLAYGADYESYAKVNKEPYVAETHGNRLVDVYVNDIGLDAYQNEDGEIPEGTVIVKTSNQRDGSSGPIFVMRKMEPGYDTDHGDWWYALHWAKVPEGERKRVGGQAQVYWHSPGKQVRYCYKCHDGYARQLGMVPVQLRTWSAGDPASP